MADTKGLPDVVMSKVQDAMKAQGRELTVAELDAALKAAYREMGLSEWSVSAFMNAGKIRLVAVRIEK